MNLKLQMNKLVYVTATATILYKNISGIRMELYIFFDHGVLNNKYIIWDMIGMSQTMCKEIISVNN